MKTAKFTRLERRVEHIASRSARQQLMRVPWKRFHKAYEEYVRWQAFVLWARAIVELEGSAPRWLEVILRKRCPGFVEQVDRSEKSELLTLQLLPWVHNRAFGFAKQEGWLDALVFYGLRDARSIGSWEYWEHCENEWKKRRPTSLPTFAEWRRSALRWELHDNVTCARVTKAVEKYLDFEATLYWLRPLLCPTTRQLPRHVNLELSQECPSLLEFMDLHICGVYQRKSKAWQKLLSWGKSHLLGHAEDKMSVDIVLRQARFHPRHVRLAHYSAHWCKFWLGNTAVRYPSLRHWRREAESYIKDESQQRRSSG